MDIYTVIGTAVFVLAAVCMAFMLKHIVSLKD